MHTWRKMLNHLAGGWGFNRRESQRKGLDEREWWASTLTWLRMRGFTPLHSGPSTTDILTDTHSHTQTWSPAKQISNQLSQSALIQLWKWSGIAGVSYFSVVSWKVFSSFSLACVLHLTQDHLEDADRSCADVCVSSRTLCLLQQATCTVDGVKVSWWAEGGSPRCKCKNHTRQIKH